MVHADASVIHEGQANAPLYTLLSGWAFRFKTLSDGRRQILNFLLRRLHRRAAEGLLI
jgi:CRP-like cAMP-binding protein